MDRLHRIVAKGEVEFLMVKECVACLIEDKVVEAVRKG